MRILFPFQGKMSPKCRLKLKIFQRLPVLNLVFFFNGTLSLSFGFCLSGFFSHFYYFEGPTSIYFFFKFMLYYAKEHLRLYLFTTPSFKLLLKQPDFEIFFQTWHCGLKVKKLQDAQRNFQLTICIATYKLQKFTLKSSKAQEVSFLIWYNSQDNSLMYPSNVS